MFASAWQILEQSYPGNSDELIDNPPKYAEPYSEQALLERAEDLGLTVLMRRSREFGMYHLMTLDILCYLDDLCRLRGLQGHSLPRRQGQKQSLDQMRRGAFGFISYCDGNFKPLFCSGFVSRWLELMEAKHPGQHTSDRAASNLCVFTCIANNFVPLSDIYLSQASAGKRTFCEGSGCI